MSRRLAAGGATILALGTAGLNVLLGQPTVDGRSSGYRPVRGHSTGDVDREGTWSMVPIGSDWTSRPTRSGSSSCRPAPRPGQTRGSHRRGRQRRPRARRRGPVLLVCVWPSNRLTFSPLIGGVFGRRTHVVRRPAVGRPGRASTGVGRCDLFFDALSRSKALPGSC